MGICVDMMDLVCTYMTRRKWNATLTYAVSEDTEMGIWVRVPRLLCMCVADLDPGYCVSL